MGFQIRGALIQTEILFDRPENEVGIYAEENQIDLCGS